MLAISAFLGLAAARAATHFASFDADLARGAAIGLPTLMQAVAASPLAIDWGLPAVRAAGAFCAVLPTALALLSMTRGMALDNEDTGREHGDDRLATPREMRALADRAVRANNVLYTANAGLPVCEHDRRTRASRRARNLNMVCYGISGLGKTFNIVVPNIMQSVGDALPERPYGIRNVPAHIASLAVGRKSAPAVELARRKPRRDPSSQLGQGFDIVNTDPKGDNVRDCGRMLEAAGVDVKVFNLVDFADGLRYNPLAYVRERYVDSKPASAIEVSVGATAVNGDRAVELGGGDAVHTGCRLRSSRDWFALSASLDLATVSESLADVPATGMGAAELDEALAATDPTDPAFEKLRRQRELKWIEEEAGAFCGGGQGAETSGRGCREIGRAVRTASYRRSSGTIAVELESCASMPMRAEVRIGIDPALVCTSWTFSTNDGQAKAGVAISDDGLVWSIGEAQPPAAGMAANVYRLEIECHMAATRVADGVALTKTIDAMAANLRGTDAQSAGSTDPFWEEAKRLCLMFLAAFLFEKYDAQARTIPNMMKLLAAALPDSGDPSEKSPLDVMVDEWEYGRVWHRAAPSGSGGRGTVRGGSWAKADTPPHDRSDSIALYCYRAFMSAAPETVQSIIVTCKSAMVNLVSDEMKDLLSADELALDTLGDEGQKQALFIVTPDTDSPFVFLTSLLVQQAIDLAQEKAYKRYGGKLPRHVRFEIDEAANIGKIPILVRAMAVVRSRNMSIALYLQSKSQLALVYGEKEAEVIVDNCTTLLFLGAQTKDTLEEISARVGKETVYSRTFQRNFGEAGLTRGSGESIQSTERAVRSPTQLARLSTGKLMCFVYGAYPILDDKVNTLEHPLYAYVNPGAKRTWLQPLAAFDERFDFREYRSRRAL